MPVSARFVAVFKSWFFSIVVAFALLTPERASADERFHHHHFIKRIVVFGDSLSDPGNAFALNGGVSVAPPDYGMGGFDALGIPEVISLIPDAPYETRRFSNGRRVWIEILADAVGLGSSVKPAVAGALFGVDDGKASNYAVGGSTAAPGLSPVPLGLQVGLFLSDVGGHVPSNTLVVIAIGGNDIRAALAAVNPMAVINQAVDSIEQSVLALHGAGARKFLVWNVPDLGSTPALQRLNTVPILTGIADAATFFSEVYNGILSARLQVLGGLQDIEIVPFNVFENLRNIQEHPRRFGLGDATTACIEPDVPLFGFPSSPPFRCAPQDRHFFWDGIHPTRAGHRIIAFLVAKELLTELVMGD